METARDNHDITIVDGSKDQSLIAKGKRTKRQRLQSPIPFAITAQSFTEDGDDNNGESSNYALNNNVATSFPPTTSAEMQGSTEEEEDMAHCLILLAQGQSRGSPKHAEDDPGPLKFSSRRFLEAPAGGGGGGTGAGKAAGYYVYECKTCSRTFSSFQALGGHRASHKKPKAMASFEKKPFGLSLEDDKEAHFKSSISSPLSFQIGNKSLYSSNKSNKVHECSICGAEFTSGQALGGHMRRHRAPVGANTALSLTSMAALDHEEQPLLTPKRQRNVLSLDLDLNLPAPEDDHRPEFKFLFGPDQQGQQEEQQQPQQQSQPQQQQQPALVFAAPTLVGCHY